MKLLQKVFLSLITTLLLTMSLAVPALAADIRGEDNISISGENKRLDNPYLFGEQIEVASPVTNDLVTAGGNINLESSVSGSIWAAGGDIRINSTVGNSVRVAGGNITIDGKINEDLVVLGGSVRVTKDASISGDLIFTGGQLQLDAPVGGYVIANGGDITINSTVAGDVSGNMGELTLGDNAQIGGDLKYTAEERAQIDNDQVAGKVTYNESHAKDKAQQGIAGIVTAGTIYKLAADILFALLLLWLLRPFLGRVMETIENGYLKSAGIGFATLVLTPLIGIISLVILWLGMSIFLLYGLLLLLSMSIMKLFIGWKTLEWWEGRNERYYTLDWKAAVVGVLIVFVVGLIPVLGWLAVFILFLLALGGLTQEIFSLTGSQREVDGRETTPRTSRKKRKK